MDTPKRGRGRPKGTKNKPTAGNIGRPRKDGRPPQKRALHLLGDSAGIQVPAHQSFPQASVQNGGPHSVINDAPNTLSQSQRAVSTLLEPSGSSAETPKINRPRGRPRGSVNGPNAGNVGRPRKDGQPPRKRQKALADQNTVPLEGYPIDPSLIQNDANCSSVQAIPSTSTHVDTPHVPTSLNPSQQPADSTDTPSPTKRARGRPKGTKNGPNAKNVGRPRKDGRPPRRRMHAEQGDGADTGSTEVAVDNHAGVRWQHTNPESYSVSLAVPQPSELPPPGPSQFEEDNAQLGDEQDLSALQQGTMLPHIGESAPVPESLHGRNTAATTPIPNGEDWFCLLPASALPHLPTIVSRISLPRPPPESSSPSTSTLPSSYGPVQMATIPSMPVSGFTIPPGALQMYLPAYPRLHPAPLPQSRYYIVPLRGQPAGPGQGSVSDGQQEPSILEASSSSTAGTANQQAPVSGTQERPKRVIHRRKSAKPRSCMHCRSEQCAGKWGISKCPVLQAKTQAG